MQQKTHQPVQFEISKQTRDSISSWMSHARLSNNNFLFKSQYLNSPHISTRQYSRIVHSWISEIGLDTAAYGTHSLRRTKSIHNLSANKESPCSPIIIRAHQAGEYRQISGNWGWRCSRNGRADRSLISWRSERAKIHLALSSNQQESLVRIMVDIWESGFQDCLRDMAVKNRIIAMTLRFLLSGHFRGIFEQPESAMSRPS